MWIARDKDGTLLLFEKKPGRAKDRWEWQERFFIIGTFPLVDVPSFVNQLEWKDAPLQIKLSMTKK